VSEGQAALTSAKKRALLTLSASASLALPRASRSRSRSPAKCTICIVSSYSRYSAVSPAVA
jgi:hypothetical protein